MIDASLLPVSLAIPASVISIDVYKRQDLTIGRDKVTRRVSDQAILDALYLGYITKCGQNTSKYLKKVQNAIDCNKM